MTKSKTAVQRACLIALATMMTAPAWAQLSEPAPGAPIVPNSPAVPQQLQPSNPATSGSGLPPAPLSPRISLSPDTLPIEIGKGPKLGRYYLNRAEEDFSYLRDPAKSNDPFDPLKFIRLSSDGHIYATLSGEERIRNESYTKSGFSFVPPNTRTSSSSATSTASTSTPAPTPASSSNSPAARRAATTTASPPA